MSARSFTKIALTLSILLLVDYSAALAQKADKTVVITQIGQGLGTTKTYINRRAIKVVILGSTTYLVARAPKWQVMFCNDENRKALSMPLAEWLKHDTYTTYAGKEWDRFVLTLSPPRDVKKFGRPVKFYKIVGAFKAGHVMPCKRMPNGDYYVLPDMNVASQALGIMQKALNCPGTASGIPLELTKREPDKEMKAFMSTPGGDEHMLCTDKIEEIVVPDSFFVYPKNYAQAKLEVTVLNDDKRRNRVDDVAKDLIQD